MDWNKGFSATYYGTFVDPATWRDIGRFEIISGTVNRDDSEMRATASVECVEYTQGEQWVRIWLDTRQGNSGEHVPLITGLSSSPEDSIEGVLIKNTVEIYSVLKPADDVLLPRGWYVGAGAEGAEAIRKLLEVTPAPVIVADNSPRLSSSIIAEEGETHLSMTEKILTAIGWRLRLLGDGAVYILPPASEVSVSFDPLSNDSIEPEMTRRMDWYECPNIFRAVDDNLSATARDDDPGHPLSTIGRGREIWAEETNCTLNAGESIADYARRRLKEEQTVATTASYSRRFHPDIVPSDLVNHNFPEQRLVGIYKVNSQSIELSYGARTSEEVTQT